MGRKRSFLFETVEENVKQRLEARRIIKDSHWLWTGPINNKGYGQISIENKPWLVHRVSYIVYNNLKLNDVGSIQYILHKCFRRDCFNPEHIYDGNLSQNAIDTVNSGMNPNKNKTHCPKGHPYSENNTKIYNGSRRCIVCAKEESIKFYRDKKIKEEIIRQNEDSQTKG